MCIADPYALELFNTKFQSIDLSSLEEIRGDGLRYALNSKLCYVGDLRSYLTGPGNQKECVVSERRLPSECGKSVCTYLKAGSQYMQTHRSVGGCRTVLRKNRLRAHHSE